jgi:hypothetical protein
VFSTRSKQRVIANPGRMVKGLFIDYIKIENINLRNDCINIYGREFIDWVPGYVPRGRFAS